MYCRMWDLEHEDNYILSLEGHNSYDHNESITCISYCPEKGKTSWVFELYYIGLCFNKRYTCTCIISFVFHRNFGWRNQHGKCCFMEVFSTSYWKSCGWRDEVETTGPGHSGGSHQTDKGKALYIKTFTRKTKKSSCYIRQIRVKLYI